MRWWVEEAFFCDEAIIKEGGKFGGDDLVCDALVKSVSFIIHSFIIHMLDQRAVGNL